MRRVFLEDIANEMIFVDSSGSRDQISTVVTFLFTANKTGALPAACILHSSQTEANYTLALAAASEAIEVEYKKFCPKVFMSDDSSAERNALAALFPNDTLLLCTFHLCQAVWRWIWQTDHMVKKDDRKRIMEIFRQVLYAKTTEDAEELYDDIINNDITQSNNELLLYLKKIWVRREEWYLSYRSDLITRGNNTNNYTEASIRIFKDIVLQRCKAFNSCALFLFFVVDVFDNYYYKRKLLGFANSRRSKPQIDYKHMCFKAKEINTIYQVDKKTFHVASGTDLNLLYTVYAEIACCDCPSGVGGEFCKHLCAIEQKLGILFKTSLVLTVSDRIQLAKLAVGQSAPEEFYENMNSQLDSNPSEFETLAQSALSTQQEEELAAVMDVQDFTEENNSRFDETLHKMRSEFDRVTAILKANQSSEALPKQKPRIEGLIASYMEGDFLKAKCISDLADPPPILTWYINDEPAPSNYVGSTSSSQPDEIGRVSRSLTLHFQLDRKLSKGNNRVEIRCKAALPGVPLPPQEITQSIHVRDPNDPQFSNQQQWYFTFSHANHNNKPLHIAWIFMLTIAIQWSIEKILK